MYHLDNAQCYFPRKPDILSLLDCELTSLSTTLKFDRDPITGKLGEMHEVTLKSSGETSQNSMSMTRAPSSSNNDVRGNISNLPFWPGGFDEPEIIMDQSVEKVDFENNLRTLAKGFSAGVEFESDNCTPKDKTMQEQEQEEEQKQEQKQEPLQSIEDEVKNIGDMIDLIAIVKEELGEFDFSKLDTEEATNVSNIEQSIFDEIVSLSEETDIPILKISEKSTETAKTEWAEELNVSTPITDFEKRIPELAMSFPYELDTFQKQAILKLEEGCNVFVTAHTSAGKTAVAEYAIALSQKHMTKVIYTSPIKALSNQQYRDFNKKFKNVGLLTGDLQINQDASCLIVTTEILQSMLYCASEILRDLEFVIFDEVHYINNDERGHVWEESVILLPQTVRIVMLSATVPSPLVFADWVGRTKKKKMYVISTAKRPIPLQHYLYTGTDGRTKNDKFLVMNENGQFLLEQWHKATNAKNVKKEQRKQRMTFQQERVTWSALISHLKTENLLPAVVFMFSRRRCGQTAALLRNINLTTESEKHTIRVFFQNSIRHLKGTDRQLPQVVMMQQLLVNGVGIHHSGILPILKEIVEMLFQSGVVKLLLATETFAMGLNMPARTVIFDSIQKHDGNTYRILSSSEYIQMSGRAGRRGHEKVGVVLILCPISVPHHDKLKSMMCGRVRNLESKFKVTYSMVLNLRRLNESVSVEAMMRRSFKESPVVKNQNLYRIELQEVENELSKLPPLTDFQEKLSQFYRAAVDYLEYVKYFKPRYFETQKHIAKCLVPGWVLLISYRSHYNKLAILLDTVQSKNIKQYRVLVLKNSDTPKAAEEILTKEASNKRLEKWHDIMALTKKEIFVPVGVPSYEMLTIAAWNILEITQFRIQVDCASVLRSCEMRQLPRFKKEPLNQACERVVQELMTLSLNASRNLSKLKSFVQLSVNNKVCTELQHLFDLKKAVNDIKWTEILNFEEQFEIIHERYELENKRNKLRLKTSDEELSLYPEYINAVAFLKHLGYIDSDERVALKGRVALQMGKNGLLITELILRNILTVLEPAEIAALLSALVFQQQALEQSYELETLQPLNFGLVEVVYDWAQAKSFAEIMEKTDVQEGIIVRCIQQLSETLRDVKNAAVIIGDPVLKEKMEEASTIIKRDIVFAASLYTQT
ncbi:Helicase SKI2W [Eufriesea mexicana]|nr:Helicase SKI2W [Eufriesea mexicana]